MLLSYFTEEAYDQLLHDISSNTQNYGSGDDWLPSYFCNKNDYYKTSTVEVNTFTPYYDSQTEKDDTQKSQEDLVNTRLMYDAFKNLTPLQASNKYLWTYLCHLPQYSKYIQDRWMREARENTIKNRFFVTTPGSLLNDNALSRLWWYGHLTYDNQSNNPYVLTEILFTNQTICTDVMDTFNRMNLNRMRGVLMAIKDFKDKIGENEGITEYFRECKKYLNHYAAVTTLEFLECSEIQKLAFNYMMKLRDEKLNGNGMTNSRRKKKK